MTAQGELDGIGSLCETKSLYNHSSNPSTAHAQWSEFENPTAEEQRVLGLGNPFAVIHRHSRISQDETTVAWATYSIEARSPRLRKVLDQIFSDYHEWYPDDSPYAVHPPFTPYVHRWEDMTTALESEDPTTKGELELLRRELGPLLQQHLDALKKARDTGVISFDLLWLILAPGCLMLSQEGGKTCISRLRDVELVPPSNIIPKQHWRLSLSQIDWNGSYTGTKTTTKKIFEYNGSMSVIKLGVYPLEFEQKHQAIREAMLARGRKFEQLRGFQVATCTGKKYTFRENRYEEWKEIPKQVSGRIIIDAHAYINCQEDLPPQPRLGRSEVWMQPVCLEEAPEESDDEASSDDGSEHGEASKKERAEEIRPLTDLECILAVPRVKGFDLSTKEWCEFDVDDIGEADWNEAPYDNLMLPAGDKDLVMAFADRQRSAGISFDDFVKHKGEGIIILLSGPPGVGKTLTAEAVADKSKTPLYMLSASELGTDPSKVDKVLARTFELCRLWCAPLLLDEADVFLEKRDSNTLARNELVSIFLRRLEFYRGLMFLTTNRISNIDSAFKSRIDLTLPYHDLDESSRRALWVKFIERHTTEATDINDEGYDELAKADLNGREIKNTVKTAFVLSRHKGEQIGMYHLRTVLGIRKRVSVAQLDDDEPPAKRRKMNGHVWEK
ncbi:hypothetical protein BHE90_009099 [Fusarium euwallaceae]|uniref:AAA+ ATPase domain-containing protein n=1 Tax=Fusarium euwallaceae TaxID=1147111 RepID=A0A430LL33_9HYPO|nr:hypothetical protein BHE90_009099 [Fusarium euwallaceae]